MQSRPFGKQILVFKSKSHFGTGFIRRGMKQEALTVKLENKKRFFDVREGSDYRLCTARGFGKGFIRRGMKPEALTAKSENKKRYLSVREGSDYRLHG